MVRFEKISVAFDDVKALDELSFEVQEGETRMILGAAGSGKTILLKVAMGLVKPDSGSLFLFGQDVTSQPEREWFAVRSRIGMQRDRSQCAMSNITMSAFCKIFCLHVTFEPCNALC